MNTVDPYQYNVWSPEQLGDQVVGWFDASVESTLYHQRDLTVATFGTSPSVGSWADRRGLPEDGDYGYLRWENGTKPATRDIFENESPNGNHLNGFNGVTWEGQNQLITAKETNRNPLQGFFTKWQPFGISGNAFEEIGFWLALRTESPINNTDKGTFILQQPITDQNTERILAHVPWEGKQFIFDAGNVSNNRINVLQYLDNNTYPYPFIKDIVLSLYAKNDPSSSEQYVSANGYEQTGTLGVTGILKDSFLFGYTPNPNELTLGELIMTVGEIDLDTRRKIEGYLAHKWNGNSTSFTDELNATHPYKTSPPTT